MAAANVQDRDHIFRCARCEVDIQGKDQFLNHLVRTVHPKPIRCGECILTYQHVTSLVRHIKDVHYVARPVLEAAAPVPLPAVAVPINEQQGAAGAVVLEEDPPLDAEEERVVDLQESAGKLVCNLRQHGAITNTIVERCQEECLRMMRDVNINLKHKVNEFLRNANIDTPESRLLLNEFVVPDPFTQLRSIKQQLSFLAKKFGMAKPQTKFLGYRIDYRLNPETAQYEPTQVPTSFQYVSVIETLKLFLSNPKNRDSVMAETPSNDGVYRSYLDGRRAKVHCLVTRFPNIIRIQLYWDDVEVVNPLGSKTTIHKIAAFYFSVQNLPYSEKGQLSSIFLLTLAYSEDLKGPDGFQKVLAPFLYELRKLESEAGVPIEIDGQPVQLRATLTVLCADSLAAHEILGFLSPSARHFCRRCMVSRPQFHQDLNAVAEKRTRPMFEDHVRRVKQNARFSTECGVKATGCPLHASRHFDATQDAVFDIFHDLLEGVCHWVVSLALRSFIQERKYFTLEDFNGRIASFNYGVPDVKNKPSANFTEESLKGKKLNQTGSQMWCLIRVFGFLVPEVPADNPNLQLVNCLQAILLIAFSEEIRDEDTIKLDTLVHNHNRMFQDLYVNNRNENEAVDLSDLDEDEEDADDPAEGVQRQAPPRPRRKVKLGNKLHHMKHLADEIREYGSLAQYWCARYEGRHQIFCRYGSCCCNFINIVKSMAQMFQVSTLSSVLNTTHRVDEIEFNGSSEIDVAHCEHAELLQAAGRRPNDVLLHVEVVRVAGETYRPGLFVLTSSATPTFSLIQAVYVFETQVYLILLPWRTVGFEDRFCAYQVEQATAGEPFAQSQKTLIRHGTFAPWNPIGQRSIFIAPRTIIF